MGCFFSVQDPPPYKRDCFNEDAKPHANKDSRTNEKSRSDVGVICLVCGKLIKNDYVSLEAHFVYCDEEFQTPPEIKTWQKVDAMTEYERKQRRFGNV